ARPGLRSDRRETRRGAWRLEAMTMKTGWSALAGALAMAFAAWAIAADPVGVLTEIRAEKARVEVKKAGEADWKVAQRRLAVRPPRVVQLEPRDTKLLPGPVTFEWSGSGTLRYKVRVSGPQGTLWEQANLPRKPVTYPASSPALEPGVRYSWQLETEGQPTQQAEFQILSADEAKRVRESLDILEPASLSGYPLSSIALMRAGYVLRDGLY